MSPHLARRAALVACVFGGSALVAHGVAARLAPPAPPPALPDPALFDAVAAAERFSGVLSHGARALLADGPDPEPALVLVLRAADLVGCEDLGRQIRELKRAYGPRRNLHVFAAGPDVEPVETFLRRERIARVRVNALAVEAVMDDARPIPTPAVLLAHRSGPVIDAVAYTGRAPNVRLRSFAQELHLLAAGGSSTPAFPEPMP